jgi:hypothetical protein
MSTPSWLRPLLASWKIKIIRSPAMSTPSLAATADGELENFGSPAMSTPSLAVTADGELEKAGKFWLAGDVYALVGRDRRWRAGK